LNNFIQRFIVKERHKKISTAKGRQAAREAEREARRHGGQTPEAEQVQAEIGEFEVRFEALELGGVREAVGELFDRLSPGSQGLTREMVERGLRMLETETTDLTGERTTQLAAMETAKNEWALDRNILCGDDYLTGFVKANIKKEYPGVLVHWFDDLNLGSFDDFRQRLFRELRGRCYGTLTQSMVDDGLEMLRTEDDSFSPSWQRSKQLSTLKNLRGDRYGLESRLSGFVKDNINKRHGIEWRGW
jgi:hypothetical protein